MHELTPDLLRRETAPCSILADRLDRRQVALWRQRFIDGGADALMRDAPRPGRTRMVDAQVQSRIVATTLQERPITATHWSTRTLVAQMGVGPTTIRRVASSPTGTRTSWASPVRRDVKFGVRGLVAAGCKLREAARPFG